MEDFQHSFESVKAIPGVEGLCILHGREIALRDLHEPIEDQSLIHLGQELRDLQSALVINKMGTALIYIYYEDKKIFYYPLADAVGIIVFCSQDINPKLIEMHFQVARNSILEWLGKEDDTPSENASALQDLSAPVVKEQKATVATSKTEVQAKSSVSEASSKDELDKLDPALMYKIQYLFREFMGPIASVVWKKKANKWLSQTERGNLRELVELMAKEFHEVEDRKGFVQKAEALLKSHGY